MRRKQKVTLWYNAMRKAGWTGTTAFCKDWGLPYGLLHNWVAGNVRNPNLDHSANDVNLLCDIFECSRQYIDQMCEDAYQIKCGNKPEHELAPLGNAEETFCRVYSEDAEVKNKEENKMISLEDFLEQQTEKSEAIEEEIESHVQPIDDEKDNYIRNDMAKAEAHTKSMKLTLTEYDEIEEAVYGKISYLKFKRLMNCIKYYCM